MIKRAEKSLDDYTKTDLHYLNEIVDNVKKQIKEELENGTDIR